MIYCDRLICIYFNLLPVILSSWHQWRRVNNFYLSLRINVQNVNFGMHFYRYVMTLDLGVPAAIIIQTNAKVITETWYVTFLFRYSLARPVWWNNQPGIWMYMNTLATVCSMRLASRHLNSALPKHPTRRLNLPPIWKRRILSWRLRFLPAAEERDTSRERASAGWRCAKRNYGPFDKIACNTYSRWVVKYAYHGCL